MDQRIYPHPFIAKEGWPFIAGTGLVALVVTALDWDFLSLICWALFVLVLQFFRDPAREIPQGEKLVLSVVDGRVLKVEKAVDPYTGQVSLLISVFMNLFNVHSQRFPVNGTVLKKVYRPGKYFNASLDKASAENEQCGLVVRASDGNQLTFVQIAGLVTHRILNYVKEGDVLKAGDRYGFIRFGSRVDMYLPLNAHPKVVIGEKVWATTTVLAVLDKPSEVEAVPEPEVRITGGEEAKPEAAETIVVDARATESASASKESAAPEEAAVSEQPAADPAAAKPAVAAGNAIPEHSAAATVSEPTVEPSPVEKPQESKARPE